MEQLVRVMNFGVSEDGYAAGEGQSLERPFGHADPMALLGWAPATASWVSRTEPGGSRGLDDYFTRDYARGIGVEIMGRNKFGPIRGPWPDLEWRGWWGEDPPFHTPVLVLTHHPRPSFSLSDTTFHFADLEPAAAVDRARELAREAGVGADVRIGGGAATVREFLDADLIDTLHVTVSPLALGGGARLWESPDELRERYTHETVPSASGVVHHLFWR